MMVTRLANLPTPPEGKTGWPWTEETPLMSGTLSGGNPWPRISVITPSYNQGQFIEQTIRSVLLQRYPNLEYIIIDGGSSDCSLEVIKKYQQHLGYWVSEPDQGQSHAINKGFARATGEIMCWLNSDDYYLPATLSLVAETLADGTGAVALVGHCVQVYVDGQPPVEGKGRYENFERLLEFWKGYQMHQPSIFWRREVFDRVGYLNENLHLTMDFDYWSRIARHFAFTNVDRALSCSTYHANAKTGDAFASYSRELMQRAPLYWPNRRLKRLSLRLSMFWHMVPVRRARRLRVVSAGHARHGLILLKKFLGAS